MTEFQQTHDSLIVNKDEAEAE